MTLKKDPNFEEKLLFENCFWFEKWHEEFGKL